MNLPFQIIRTADVRKLQAENDLMHRILQSDTDMIHQLYDAVKCYQDTLQQYEQALEKMTQSRNRANASSKFWRNECEYVKEVLAEHAAEVTTKPAEPAPTPEPAESERTCYNCKYFGGITSYNASGRILFRCTAGIPEVFENPKISCHSFWEPRAGGASEPHETL